MKTSLDILSGLYQVIRPQVASLITGKVYLNEEPQGDQKENITLGLLVNTVDYVQRAVLNVNIHVMGINENQANLARMKEIVEVVMPLIHEQEYFISGVTLHLEVEDDKGVFKDLDNKGKYFYNVRVNCITI